MKFLFAAREFGLLLLHEARQICASNVRADGDRVR
jgi:hypothetical protein